MKTILGYMPRGTGKGYPFDILFDETVNAMEHGVKGLSALVLWGGEDISSRYYEHMPHPYTQNRGGPSERDKNEWQAMTEARDMGIPIIGVCRGAQFLCVFSGGKLIQHVNGHGQSHNVVTNDGDVMLTSSCHHQMMYPYDVEHIMLAKTLGNRSLCYEDGNENPIPMTEEPEVVYFPKTRGLAIQGHPEWMDENSPFVEYCLDLVETHLFTEIETV